MLATVEKEVEKLVEEVIRLERENEKLRLRIAELETELTEKDSDYI
jgi:regulator of replication initiation timing